MAHFPRPRKTIFASDYPAGVDACEQAAGVGGLVILDPDASIDISGLASKTLLARWEGHGGRIIRGACELTADLWAPPGVQILDETGWGQVNFINNASPDAAWFGARTDRANNAIALRAWALSCGPREGSIGGDRFAILWDVLLPGGFAAKGQGSSKTSIDGQDIGKLGVNVTGISRTNPVEVTFSGPHGLANGARAVVAYAKGLTEINGLPRAITVTAANKYTIPVDGSAFPNAWISGGFCYVGLNTSANVTGISNAAQAHVLWDVPHGVKQFQTIILDTVVGMTGVNGVPALVLSVPSATELVLDLDTTLAGAWVSGGACDAPGMLWCRGAGPVQLDALSVDPTIGVSSLSWAGAQPLSQNDLVCIWDPNDGSYLNVRANYHAGEFALVVDANGASVNLAGGLYAGYDKTVVNTYRMDMATCALRGMSLLAQKWTPLAAFRGTFLRDSSWVDVVFSGSVDKSHSIQKSQGLTYDRCRGLQWSDTISGFSAYAFSFGNCQDVEIHECDGIADTHVYTTGGNNDICCIVNRNIIGTGCDGKTHSGKASSIVYDFHGNTEWSGWINCGTAGGVRLGGDHCWFIAMPVRAYPKTGTQTGISLQINECRGPNFKVANCVLSSASDDANDGMAVNVGSNQGFGPGMLNDGTLELINNTYLATNAGSSSPVINIEQGGSTRKIDVLIDGGIVDCANTSSLAVRVFAAHGKNFNSVQVNLAKSNANYSIANADEIIIDRAHITGNAANAPGIMITGAPKKIKINSWSIKDVQQNAIYLNTNVLVDGITNTDPAVVTMKGSHGLTGITNATLTGVVSATGAMATALNGISKAVTIIDEISFSVPMAGAPFVADSYSSGGQYSPNVVGLEAAIGPGQFDNWNLHNGAAGAIEGIRSSHIAKTTLVGVKSGTPAFGTPVAFAMLNGTDFYKTGCVGSYSIDPTTVGATLGITGAHVDFWPPRTVALTSAATIVVDASQSEAFEVVLGVDATLANPAFPQDGQSYVFTITQDPVTPRTLAFGTKYKFAGGSKTISTATGAVDQITAVYRSSTDTLDCILSKAFA